MGKKPYIDVDSQKILEYLQREFQIPESGDGRAHQRKPWCVVLTIQFNDSSDQLTITNKAEITTHDLSRGGFGFIFNQNMEVKSTISACFEMLPNKPIIHGEVRSCRRLFGQQYRIGVEFTNVKRSEEPVKAVEVEKKHKEI